MTEKKSQWVKEIYSWYDQYKEHLIGLQNAPKNIQDSFTEEEKNEIYAHNIDFYTAVKLFLENNFQLTAMLPPPPPPPDDDE